MAANQRPQDASIRFDETRRCFQLDAGDMSYVFGLFRDSWPVHLYWGPRIRAYGGSHPVRLADRAFSANPDPTNRAFSLDTAPQEYPAFGNTDYRVPAVQIEMPDGSRMTDFRYAGHEIVDGKPMPKGIPATYCEADDEAKTLIVTLKDTLFPIEAKLFYTVFRGRSAMTRRVEIVSGMDAPVKLLRVLSMNVDFRDDRFRLIHLPGAWGRERDVVEKPLSFGIINLESRRGASSHQMNPFLALARPDATESHGDAYGFNLVWSGSFLGQIEVDGFHNTRVSLGINPFDFSWTLNPGETFATPETVMVHSAEGLGGMSRTFHRLYRERLCRGAWRDRERPMLINNWEATYFDFDAEKILSIVRAAKPLGIELMVLDDGWFGRRNDDRSSLGDWFVNLDKLPGGLKDLADRVVGEGLRFGLWFEPEMISADSDLYRAHPDWCLHVKDRRRSESRNQLVLDYSRADVREAIVGMLRGILGSAPIGYVKWDMNRHMTEVGSALLPPDRQREVGVRYMLGLYEVLEQITSEFPDILFESCSGGGGRFDPGMLYYMPQTWTSDNTDAVERLKIQYGTSLAYPAVSMGSHVSAVPNHQVGRLTGMPMRGDVAMAGNLGYELDVTRLPEEELADIRRQTALYAKIRPIVQFGDQYRLLSPFKDGRTAWLFVDDAKERAVAFYYKHASIAQEAFVQLKLDGLNPDASYRVEMSEFSRGWHGEALNNAEPNGGELPDGGVYGGDELMCVGLPIPMLAGDWRSCRILIEKV